MLLLFFSCTYFSGTYGVVELLVPSSFTRCVLRIDSAELQKLKGMSIVNPLSAFTNYRQTF